jgi:hypothetical protein
VVCVGTCCGGRRPLLRRAPQRRSRGQFLVRPPLRERRSPAATGPSVVRSSLMAQVFQTNAEAVGAGTANASPLRLVPCAAARRFHRWTDVKHARKFEGRGPGLRSRPGPVDRGQRGASVHGERLSPNRSTCRLPRPHALHAPCRRLGRVLPKVVGASVRALAVRREGHWLGQDHAVRCAMSSTDSRGGASGARSASSKHSASSAFHASSTGAPGTRTLRRSRLIS